jgi:hypothetical protein
MRETLEAVRRYLQLTKHWPQAYVPSPLFLEGDIQPNPFRCFEGAQLTLIDGGGPVIDQRLITELRYVRLARVGQ